MMKPIDKKYVLEIDGMHGGYFVDVNSALAWVDSNLVHHSHRRGVKVFCGKVCMYNGKRGR